jgi:hypothetical protein
MGENLVYSAPGHDVAAQKQRDIRFTIHCVRIRPSLFCAGQPGSERHETGSHEDLSSPDQYRPSIHRPDPSTAFNPRGGTLQPTSGYCHCTEELRGCFRNKSPREQLKS